MAFKILVAEDEEITLKHLINALVKAGYSAIGTNNGHDALERIENNHFDLLIADIKMPGLTGIELLEKIREKQIDSEVIIITGFGSISSVVEAMKRALTTTSRSPSTSMNCFSRSGRYGNNGPSRRKISRSRPTSAWTRRCRSSQKARA